MDEARSGKGIIKGVVSRVLHILTSLSHWVMHSIYYLHCPPPSPHSRTQSPSYARCDEGLWPNPKPETIKTW